MLKTRIRHDACRSSVIQRKCAIITKPSFLISSYLSLDNVKKNFLTLTLFDLKIIHSLKGSKGRCHRITKI